MHGAGADTHTGEVSISSSRRATAGVRMSIDLERVPFFGLNAVSAVGGPGGYAAASARVSARLVTMRSRRAAIPDRASSRRRPISARSAAVRPRGHPSPPCAAARHGAPRVDHGVTRDPPVSPLRRRERGNRWQVRWSICCGQFLALFAHLEQCIRSRCDGSDLAASIGRCEKVRECSFQLSRSPVRNYRGQNNSLFIDSAADFERPGRAS